MTLLIYLKALGTVSLMFTGAAIVVGIFMAVMELIEAKCGEIGGIVAILVIFLLLLALPVAVGMSR